MDGVSKGLLQLHYHIKQLFKSMRKKYDCFMFNNELSTIGVRFETLYNYVDNFVLVESPISHLGDKKPLHFDQNKHLFKKYENKIIHKVLGLKEESGWGKENEHRYKISQLLKEIGPSDEDLIFMSDADEIPDPESFNQILGEPYYFFNQLYFIYFNNLWSGKAVTGTGVCSYETLLNLDERYEKKGLQLLRNSKDFISRIQGGWHYSYFGNNQTISEKSRRIAEGNNDQSNDKTSPEKVSEQIQEALKTMKSPYSHKPLKKLNFNKRVQVLEYSTAKDGEWIDGSDVFNVFPNVPEEMLKKLMIPT
jgi:beta-1,4-mannosyl-glycoprotein beta-1,4-N-acetylglucosaminyltransferase